MTQMDCGRPTVWQYVTRLSAFLRGPWPYALLILLGIAARFRQFLSNPSFWYDEAALARSIYEFSFAELIGPLPTRNITPPIYLWLLRACYDLFGPSEWSMRLPAFVFGVVGLALFVPLARRWLGNPGWYWAAGFCALSVHCVTHSYEVRQYAADFLMSVAVLFVAHCYLHARSDSRRRLATGALLALAAFGPWFSLPGVFVLAAASGAMFADFLEKRERTKLLPWIGLNVTLLVSCLAVWYVQARHMYYPGLKDEWTFVWGGFPRDYSARTLLTWTALAPERVAHYATTGLGVPLLSLALIGLVRSWRRSRAEYVLLAGPPLLAYLAALAGKYPFADRTLFFLAPCVWLLAVEGLLWLSERGAAARVLVPLVAVALLAPGIVSTSKMCVRVRAKMEYREALAYVHEQRGRDEAVWNWCEDLNLVYSDYINPEWKHERPDDPTDPTAAVRAAGTRPLWIVTASNRVDEMTDPLRPLSLRQTLSRDFFGVKVLRFVPER